MRPTLTGHERIDQRSIALHAAIARKLEADPRLLAIARDNIDRWWDTDGGSRPSLAEWRAILGRSAAIGAESIAESNEQGLYNVPSLQPGANDFFANQAGQNPPPFKFNQFGGTSQPAARVSRIIRICGLSAAYRRYDISSVIGMNRQPACDFRAEHLEPFGVRAAIFSWICGVKSPKL